MKSFLIAIVMLGLTVASSAQAGADSLSHWTLGGNTSLTFNQVSLRYWAAGGKNSMSGTFLFKTFANYKSENMTWDNTLDIGYGMTKYSHEDLQKSEDKIYLSSQYGYNAARQKLFYSALFDIKTQFASGYKYTSADTTRISDFFAPAYINLSLGLLYKPNDVFMAYLSPLTSRLTIVTDTVLSTTYGLDAGKKLRAEYGATAKIEIKKDNLVKNVDFYLRSLFFSNLVDNPQYIDVDCETGFNFRVNEFLTALLKFNLLFDNDTKYVETTVDADGNAVKRERGARLQCKQMFGFGLAYKW